MLKDKLKEYASDPYRSTSVSYDSRTQLYTVYSRYYPSFDKPEYTVLGTCNSSELEGLKNAGIIY
jgi:hypothetical protein